MLNNQQQNQENPTSRLEEIKDLAQSAEIEKLLTSTHAIIYCYEKENTIDEGEICSLMCDVINVIVTLQIIRDIAK